MPNKAPVLITVYDRFDTLVRCIEALKACDCASETDLYIASDGAQSAASQEKIRQIRAFIATIDGFKSVTAFNRHKNIGIRKSFKLAERRILNEYERIIFLEDDVIVAPYFLNFMNNMLDKYAEDDKIFSVSGFVADEITRVTDRFYTFRSFLHCPWGYGMWKRSLDKVDDAANNFTWFKRNKMLAICLALRNPVIFASLYADYKNPQLDFGDVRITCQMLEQQLYTIYPSKSLTKNVGGDGRGLRGYKDEKLRFQELYTKKSGSLERVEDLRLSNMMFAYGADKKLTYVTSLIRFLIGIFK